MTSAALEHVNVTVRNSERTARRLCELFQWKIRWSGPSVHGGHSVHVGGADSYLAVYSEAKPEPHVRPNVHQAVALNHIGIVVDDLDAAETRIKRAGYTPVSHADYEPGRRFYFRDEDDVEYEVISYTAERGRFWKTIWKSIGTWAQYAALTK